jgi:uncharacterized protein YihD (DUF1040 family)
MRDPQRIDQVIEVLREIWQLQPDLRLGQIVVTAVRPSEPCPEIFNAEDDVLLRGLCNYRQLLSQAAGQAPDESVGA